MTSEANTIATSVNERHLAVETWESIMNTPAPAHGRLHATIAAILDAPLRQRALAILQDRVIQYPKFKEILQQAHWMFLEPPTIRARGLIVQADCNNGKTALAYLMDRRFQPQDGGAGPCAISISMSGVRDARTVYGRILEKLGGPVLVSHRLSDREPVVLSLLEKTNCRLLILDEVQDLTFGSEKDQQRVLQSIKTIMNALRLPVLALGTSKAGHWFRSDPHLAARFGETHLPVWKADRSLAAFLATYERYLPLKEASNLHEREKVAFLAKTGEGKLGAIVARVQNAALMALEQGEESITLAHLQAAEFRPGKLLIESKEMAA